MPSHLLRSFAFAALTGLIVSACGPSGAPGTASNPAQETILTEQALAIEVQLTGSAVSPSHCAKSTASVASTLIPGATPTPSVPQVHILHGTSCSAGPDSTDQAVDRLATGAILEIFGRSTHLD